MSDIYVLKEYYIRYLKDIRKISDTSVYKYTNALNTISKHIRDHGYATGSSIYDVYDFGELSVIKERLFRDPEFVALDTRGHRMYSAALNNYTKFAQGESFASIGQGIVTLDIELPVPDSTAVKRIIRQRDGIIKRQSIESAQYMCEVDRHHTTFIAASTNKPYMEGHHAIPMREQDHFLHSLDVYANLICLCPVCHRMLHYGQKADKVPVLQRIYNERADRLAHSGILLSKEEFVRIGL